MSPGQFVLKRGSGWSLALCFCRRSRRCACFRIVGGEQSLLPARYVSGWGSPPRKTPSACLAAAGTVPCCCRRRICCPRSFGRRRFGRGLALLICILCVWMSGSRGCAGQSADWPGFHRGSSGPPTTIQKSLGGPSPFAVASVPIACMVWRQMNVPLRPGIPLRCWDAFSRDNRPNRDLAVRSRRLARAQRIPWARLLVVSGSTRGITAFESMYGMGGFQISPQRLYQLVLVGDWRCGRTGCLPASSRLRFCPPCLRIVGPSE
jgi:hypothetical protein